MAEGRTTVAEGKMLRTSCSPSAYQFLKMILHVSHKLLFFLSSYQSFSNLLKPFWIHTLVLKKREGESTVAFKADIWMRRSTSCFWASSAITPAASTWTSENEKLLIHGSDTQKVKVSNPASLSCHPDPESRILPIPSLVITAEQVVDGVRVTNGSLQRVLVAEVNLHGDNFSEITHDLQVAHIVLITVRDNDMSTLASCGSRTKKVVAMLDKIGLLVVIGVIGRTETVDQVASKESSAAKDSNDVSVGRRAMKRLKIEHVSDQINS